MGGSLAIGCASSTARVRALSVRRADRALGHPLGMADQPVPGLELRVHEDADVLRQLVEVVIGHDEDVPKADPG